MPTTGWISRPPPICPAARRVNSSSARCSGSRVWKATTFFQPSVRKCSRSSAGVRLSSTKSKCGGVRDDLQPPGGVVARLAVQVGDRRVPGVGRAVGAPGFRRLVEGVDLLDVQEGQQVAVDVLQGERPALGDAVAGMDGQGHRQGPEGAVGQALLGDDPVVVGPAEEPSERGEGAGGPAVRGRRGRVRRASGWRSPWPSPASRPRGRPRPRGPRAARRRGCSGHRWPRNALQKSPCS